MKDGPGYPVTYMPQLDSLRAFAALGVFAQHFLDGGNLFASKIPLGDLGVRMFFVLSGYLITLILLNSRQNIAEGKTSRSRVIGSFYARRFLRLIPVYFLFISIMFAFVPDVRQYAGWFYPYLQNIHFALIGEFTAGNHLWTLAVEEQYYLIWPFIILLLPARYLLTAIAIAVILGPLSRVGFVGLGMSHFSASMLMPSHLDTLGIGALLAAWKFANSGKVDNRLLVGSLALGFVMLGAVFATKVLGFTSTVEFLLGELGAGLVFVAIIGWAADGFRGPLGWLLTLPIFVYLGRISYGMYVYHWFTPHVVEYLAPMIGLSPPENEWLRLTVYTVLSILVAALSWHAMEQPILRLKRRFDYAKTRSVNADAVTG